MTSTQEPWTSWLCDLEADDYCFINSVDSGTLPSQNDIAAPQENSINSSKRSLSSDSTMSYNNLSGDDNTTSFERPTKTFKTSPSPSSFILSFNTANPVTVTPVLNTDSALRPKGSINKVVNQKREPRRRNNNQKTNGSATGRSPHHAHDHIIAERMRREKISQQFIALSALIPGLKKMDKATVLGDAVKYVKQLQEQVKVLEDEKATKKTVESSVVYVEKTQLYAEEDVSDTTSSNSVDGNSYDNTKTNRSLPEVEARVSEKNVLIRIHCQKQKGLLMYMLKEIEKLHLSVINSSAMPFGSSIVDITITAEMEDGYRISVKEVARKLRMGLMQVM